MTSVFDEFKGVAVINTLRSCQLFTGLPAADLESIAAVTVVKALDKDAYLFHEGDAAQGFYIVQRGAVNVHRVSAAGKEQIIHVFRTGDSFAEVALDPRRVIPPTPGRWNRPKFCSCKRPAFWPCCVANPNSRSACWVR